MAQQYDSSQTNITRNVHDCASVLKRRLATHPDGTREEFAQYMGQWPGCNELNDWQRGRILSGHFADTDDSVTTAPLPSSYMRQSHDVHAWQHKAWWRWVTVASITIAICMFVLYNLTELHKQKWVLPLSIFIAVSALILWIWRTIRVYGLGGLGQKTSHLWSSPYQYFDEDMEALRASQYPGEVYQPPGQYDQGQYDQGQYDQGQYDQGQYGQ